MRTENWTQDYYGMISTVVVDVRDGDTVWVSNALVEEMGLKREDGQEVPDGMREQFVWEFPYDTVRDALTKTGWTRATAATG